MTSAPKRQISGMSAFIVVWIGQIVSILATSMSQFALTIWAYEKTQSATALGLMQVFFITPFLLISPIAGAMVDRHNRKLMMMLSDLGAGFATILILVLQAAGALQIWHLYLTAAITGLFSSFQWPAYSASISLMIPKEQLGRANGLMSLMEAGPGVIAPLLAGALLPLVHLTGILLFDVMTFVLAVAALSIIFVPKPPKTEEGKQGQGSLLKEAAYGFRYIFARPSLLGLQMVFFLGNLFAGIGFTVLAPMILSRTGNSEIAFGAVQTAGAIGGVIGGILMSVWGGPKRRVHGVLFGHVLSGLCWVLLMGPGRGLIAWAASSFLSSLLVAPINGSNQAIWQSKVALDVQGRVFSARRLIAWLTNPISPLIAGVVADQWLEPAFRNQTPFAQSFAWLVGDGPGAGMSLMFIVCGAMMSLTGALAYLFPAVRNAEDILPDAQPHV
ncbi:MAG TPA: MFS transporter [Thermoflexales bacterium]|nr:MFS transporter [Thermoflexales bacterium]